MKSAAAPEFAVCPKTLGVSHQAENQEPNQTENRKKSLFMIELELELNINCFFEHNIMLFEHNIGYLNIIYVI